MVGGRSQYESLVGREGSRSRCMQRMQHAGQIKHAQNKDHILRNLSGLAKYEVDEVSHLEGGASHSTLNYFSRSQNNPLNAFFSNRQQQIIKTIRSMGKGHLADGIDIYNFNLDI